MRVWAYALALASSVLRLLPDKFLSKIFQNLVIIARVNLMIRLNQVYKGQLGGSGIRIKMHRDSFLSKIFLTNQILYPIYRHSHKKESCPKMYQIILLDLLLEFSSLIS